MRRLILHCGLHKTGTSYIQLALMQNASILEKHGLFYPEALRSPIGSHHEASKAIQTESWRAKWLPLLATDAPDILISAEDFTHTFNKDKGYIQRILDLAAEHSRKLLLVFYLRRQDELKESVYAEIVKHWYRGNISEDEHYPFNFHELISQISDVAGFRRILLRPYLRSAWFSGDILNDLLHSIGYDAVLNILSELPYANVSPNRRVRLYLGQIDKSDIRHPIAASDALISSRVIQEDGQKYVMAPEQRRQFVQSYRSSNLELLSAFPDVDLRSCLLSEPDPAEHWTPPQPITASERQNADRIIARFRSSSDTASTEIVKKTDNGEQRMFSAVLMKERFILPIEISKFASENGHRELTAKVESKDQSWIATRTLPVQEKIHRLSLDIGWLQSLGYTAGDRLSLSVDGPTIFISLRTSTLEEEFENAPVTSTGLKVPPGWLVQAFTGVPDARNFMADGQREASLYLEWYEKWFGRLPDEVRVLDFGCGCGRVLQHLPQRGSRQYFGIDLHRDAVDWLRMAQPSAQVYYGSETPPLDTAIGEIDFLYAISVFTHLSEQHEAAWMAEWKRILKDGSALFVTFRGEDWLEQHSTPQHRELILEGMEKNGGRFFQAHSFWEGIFPAFYGGAYHTHEFVKRTWGQEFEILEILPCDRTQNRQNLAIMRTRK